MDGTTPKKGDIIKNLWAGENNPQKYLLYIGKSSMQRSKTYRCVCYSGDNVHLLRDDARIEIVGHMDEFDRFIEALKKLKDM